MCGFSCGNFPGYSALAYLAWLPLISLNTLCFRHFSIWLCNRASMQGRCMLSTAPHRSPTVHAPTHLQHTFIHTLSWEDTQNWDLVEKDSVVYCTTHLLIVLPLSLPYTLPRSSPTLSPPQDTHVTQTSRFLLTPHFLHTFTHIPTHTGHPRDPELGPGGEGARRLLHRLLHHRLPRLHRRCCQPLRRQRQDLLHGAYYSLCFDLG